VGERCKEVGKMHAGRGRKNNSEALSGTKNAISKWSRQNAKGVNIIGLKTGTVPHVRRQMQEGWRGQNNLTTANGARGGRGQPKKKLGGGGLGGEGEGPVRVLERSQKSWPGRGPPTESGGGGELFSRHQVGCSAKKGGMIDRK